MEPNVWVLLVFVLREWDEIPIIIHGPVDVQMVAR